MKDNESTFELIKKCLFFSSAYGITHLLARQMYVKLLPETFFKLPRNEKIMVAEKICSSLNAIVLSTSSFYLLFRTNEFKGSFGVLRNYPQTLDFTFSSYIGYSLYDLVTMALVGDELNMWAHHILGIIGAFLTLKYRYLSYFPTVFLFTEITVLPTNFVYLLRIFYRKGKTMTAALWTRSVMFACFRTFVAPYCLYSAYKEIRSSIKGPVNLESFKATVYDELQNVPKFLIILCLFNIGALGYINLSWSIKMLKSIMKKIKKN